MTNAAEVARAAADAANLDADIRRLIEIEDAIAKIRAQIAAADLARQQGGKPIDRDWFDQMQTALRLKREHDEIIARKYRRWRKQIKDLIIEVMHERLDDDAWGAVMQEALMRLAREEA